MQLLRKSLPIIVLTLFHLCCVAQKLIPPPIIQESWSQDYEPFRVVGNLYYVGTYDLASYLIVTPNGNILINTGLPGSESLIRKHIEALGFKFSDIKILLATHAHYDHVGAMATIKKMTGAKIIVHEKDAPLLADGGNSDYAFGGNGSTFLPVKADRLLHHDQDTVRLGGMQIVVLHHPGHTKGACSFLFNVKDSIRTYRVLVANMPTILDQTKFPGMPTYPNVGKDYAYTFDAMRNIQFDIWVASHASQFGLHKKRKPGNAYNPNAFIDQKGYDTLLDELKQAYLKKIADK
jgi:metallo-beta-lactamase class B